MFLFVILLIFSRLPILPLYFNQTETLYVEIAITPEERKTGLMFREYLPENQGMLFVFEKSDTLKFWMKNTLIPLDIAFIDSSGVIVDIQSMAPLDTLIHKSKKPAKYALEVNAGWFKRHKIKIGDRVSGPALIKGY